MAIEPAQNSPRPAVGTMNPPRVAERSPTMKIPGVRLFSCLTAGFWSTLLSLACLGTPAAWAHGGGGGGGGHGGGMGGFGGMSGFGGMGGHMGGMGGFGGMGGMGSHVAGSGLGGFGGSFGHLGFGYGHGYGRGYGYGVGGFYPAFGFGYGLGYPYYGLGYGFGYPYGLYGLGGYGLGLYGLGGYGLGYGLGLGGFGYPGWGYGYLYPGMGFFGGNFGLGNLYTSALYGGLNIDPYSSLGYFTNPYGGFGYSSAYGQGADSSDTSMPATNQRFLGINEEPAVAPDGTRGMRITKIFENMPAAQAGLQVGDILESANGYRTEVRGNLAWIIANAMPNNELKIIFHSAKDGKRYQVTAKIP